MSNCKRIFTAEEDEIIRKYHNSRYGWVTIVVRMLKTSSKTLVAHLIDLGLSKPERSYKKAEEIKKSKEEEEKIRKVFAECGLNYPVREKRKRATREEMLHRPTKHKTFDVEKSNKEWAKKMEAYRSSEENVTRNYFSGTWGIMHTDWTIGKTPRSKFEVMMDECIIRKHGKQ